MHSHVSGVLLSMFVISVRISEQISLAFSSTLYSFAIWDMVRHRIGISWLVNSWVSKLGGEGGYRWKIVLIPYLRRINGNSRNIQTPCCSWSLSMAPGWIEAGDDVGVVDMLC